MVFFTKHNYYIHILALHFGMSILNCFSFPIFPNQNANHTIIFPLKRNLLCFFITYPERFIFEHKLTK